MGAERLGAAVDNVAAANADAEIGEAAANRERRTKSAALDAQAVSGETQADAEKAALGDVPGYIINDLQNIVQFALDDTTDVLDLTLYPGVPVTYNMLP